MSRAIHSTNISHPPIRHSHHPPSLSTIEIAPNLCMRLLASESKFGRSRGRNFFSDHTLTQSIERKTGRKSGPNFASCPRSNDASERYAICNGTKGRRGRGWRNSQSTQNGRKNRIALSEFPNASLVAWGENIDRKVSAVLGRTGGIDHPRLRGFSPVLLPFSAWTESKHLLKKQGTPEEGEQEEVGGGRRSRCLR